MIENIIKLSILNFINEDSLEFIGKKLKEDGFYILQLDGENIKDATSFFKKVVEVFPQDPPLSGKCNWDAFTDSLWGGLDELSEEKVAFIWTKVENMFEYGIPDLFMALDCFVELARSVSNYETGISKPIKLIIFLIGKGKNFISLKEYEIKQC